MAPVAILTRPEGKNEALAARLSERGWHVLALPALHVAPLPASSHPLPLPEAFDLVVFVSGNAARLYAEQLKGNGQSLAWPVGTVAATVGPASAQALVGAMRLKNGQTVLHAPPDAPRYDSEALWERIQGLPEQPRRVLLVRGTQGRDWLADRLSESGAQVTCHAVYERRAAEWSAQASEQLRDWARQGRPAAWLLTSGQGIEAVRSRLRDAGLADWWLACPVVVTHPGLAAKLDIGIGGQRTAMVKTCLPDDGAILEALISSCIF